MTGGERNSREGVERRRDYIVFVDNIPPRLDKFALKGIFQKVGKLSDSYIPIRKGSRSKRRYGFVHYWKLDEAMRNIVKFNNSTIRRHRIQVCMAKFER